MGSHRKTLVAAAVPVGFLLSGALIWQASYAAFTATTANTGNSWQAGSVTLTDNDSGSAMFSASGLVPGSTGARCLEVTYGGNVAVDVRMYAAYGAASDLADNLDLVVEQGTATANDCTGWTSAATLYSGQADGFVAAHANWTSGADTWAPSAPAIRWYRIAYTLQDESEAQGDALDLAFTWEAQSS